jgi:hypothetical protein
MLVPTDFFLNAILAASVNSVTGGDFAGPLYHAYVVLIKETFTPSHSLTLADVVEAEFTGYARVEILTWTAIHTDANGQPSIDSVTSVFFQPTDPITVADVIVGWGLVDAATDGNLLATEKFDTPVPMQTSLNGLDLVAHVALSITQGIGTGVVID